LDYPPEYKGLFNFVYVGQWQPRKSTEEICRAFIKAFPKEANVKLHLSADTLFPSDNYKNTEERLKAYGIEDPRIIPVHFEERADYIRRLQSAHCFVSCARSEGWGLPIIEAMACGVPTIVADWSGSTEYATDCIRVPIKKLIKPFGIYGNWDVPGQWCEPDFEVLVSAMKEVVEKYDIAKANALKSSDRIRDKFSWEAAAKKAFVHLEQLHNAIQKQTKETTFSDGVVPKDLYTKKEMIALARSRGWKIKDMEKEKEVFVIGCWPNSQEKLETLVETIVQLKSYGSPVIISTHYALPVPVVEMADYVIYEKNNVLSGDWTANYFRTNGKGEREEKKSAIPYHGVACLNAIRNAVDFCHGKFDRMFYLEYDSEVDYDSVVKATHESLKPMTCIDYEGRSIRTDVWGGDIEFLYKAIPVISSWEEYTAGMKDINSEYILEDYLCKAIGKENINIIKLDVGNRYDQVDYNVWPDDVMICNFADGPFLNIAGLSKREYDVAYSVGGKNIYTVKQKVGMWSKAAPKYYLPWAITASIDGIEKFRHEMDLSGKRVLISMGSKALGDTIAWMPYVEEFRKKHNCHVICSGWWQEIFDYPEIEFVKPGAEVQNVYAVYQVGCFDEQPDKNPTNWRTIPLQQVSADILGIKNDPMKAKLKQTATDPISVKPYICFSEFSTMRNKLWNRPNAWQSIIDYCITLGYECVSVSMEPTTLKNVIAHNGQSIQRTIEDIRGCAFYIGLNHGPAWLAYILDKKCIMVTGVSEEWNDFPNPHRIAINHNVCGVGCFNDPALKIDRGWLWCPRNKDYACTKEITPGMVIHEIKKVREEIGHAVKKGEKQEGHQRKHKGNGESRTPAEASGGSFVGDSAEV
jgi:autotransporter strand-loop-strand O-heptosyltransferase